jgi:hypothetical protein
MKRIVVFILVILISLVASSSLNAQEVIEYKGDTAVVISKEAVKTLNTIIIEREFMHDQLQVYADFRRIDSLTISAQDSIIKQKDLIISKQKKYYLESVNNLNQQFDDEIRRVARSSSFLTGLCIILTGILILQ